MPTESTWTWRNNPRRPKRPTVVCQCLVCGALFPRHASAIDRGKGRYCSAAHRSQGRRFRTLLRRIIADTQRPLVVHGVARCCEECGVTFRVKPSRVAMGRGRFCGVACQRRWDTRESERRFWLHGNCTHRPGHWLWTGDYDPDGYGVFCVRDKVKQRPRSVRAHQWAWFLVYGEWPTLQLCHQCPYRTCFNPACLVEGTAKDNAADREAWGKHARGERNWKASLTDARAAEIREAGREIPRSPTGRVARGQLQTLAQRFGISPGLVGRILSGKGYPDAHPRRTVPLLGPE